MATTDAFISLLEIVNSWLLRNTKTVHAKYRAIKFAADAVRELKLTSLEVVNHKLLYRDPKQQWWELPKDYTDWVSVGARRGERWMPVGVSDTLMPLPQTYAPAEYSEEYGAGFSHGTWGNWMNGKYAVAAGAFDGADFSDADFATEDGGVLTSTGYGFSAAGVSGGGYAYAGGYGGLYPSWMGDYISSDFNSLKGQRMDEVVINAKSGVIMCPQGYPSTELYLVYVGIGSADTMTQIPVQAQACIEAYIDWQWQKTKKNGVNVRGLQQDYEFQHQILRARQNTLTIATIVGIIDKKYQHRDGYDGRGIGAGDTINAGGLTPDPTPFTGYIPKAYTVGVDVLAGNSFSDPDLIGATLAPEITVASSPLDYASVGIGFNPLTGTLDFTAIGGLTNGTIVSLWYLPATP